MFKEVSLFSMVICRSTTQALCSAPLIVEKWLWLKVRNCQHWSLHFSGP